MNGPAPRQGDFDDVVRSLRAALPDRDLQVRAIPVAETVIVLPAECLHRAVSLVVEQVGIRHLSTITGDEVGDEILLRYHFWQGTGLTLEVAVSPDASHVASVTDLIPGAAFYEREVFGMLGVVFDGHVGLNPLLQAEDWDGPPPLRRGALDE